MGADSLVAIAWNEENDLFMTRAESAEALLESFFSVKEWDFVRHLYRALSEESSFEFEQSRVEFEGERVHLSERSGSVRLAKETFLKMSLELFDIMIVGANSDHYSVRYEPWWHEFTETAYQLRCKMELIV